jgi:putative hydrolase of the HAD superfamily
MGTIRAAIFDVGGVLTNSPVTALIDYARQQGISDETRTRIFAGDTSPWSRYERSELTPSAFASEFDAILREAGGRTSGQAFLDWFARSWGERPEMIAVVKALKGHVRLGCITNNILFESPDPTHVSGADVRGLFEVVIESAKVGVRKPEPAIFRMACDALAVDPTETVFLDDMGVNLKGARELGMVTIRVDHTFSAIDELQSVLGIPLPRP